jgi:hypothetical protein
MSHPQQPELSRSGHTPVVQDHDQEVAEVVDQAPAGDRPEGTVPPANRPGHQDDDVQDQPDLDAMAERLGIRSEDDRS